MVALHPRHKLEYFKNHSWPDEWITEAEHITKAALLRTYAAKASAQPVDDAEAGTEGVEIATESQSKVRSRSDCH